MLSLGHGRQDPGTTPLPRSPKVKKDGQEADSKTQRTPPTAKIPGEDPSSSLKPGPALGPANPAVAGVWPPGPTWALAASSCTQSTTHKAKGPDGSLRCAHGHPGEPQPTAVSRDPGILGGFLVDPHWGQGLPDDRPLCGHRQATPVPQGRERRDRPTKRMHPPSAWWGWGRPLCPPASLLPSFLWFHWYFPGLHPHPRPELRRETQCSQPPTPLLGLSGELLEGWRWEGGAQPGQG